MSAGNQYDEHWTIERAKEFMEEAVKLSNSKEFDFIGEVAKEQGSYKEVYNYLVDKFPELNNLLKQIKSNCECNCFYNGKMGKIVPSLSIMNLKSNHGWTDRIQQDLKHDGKIQVDKIKVEIVSGSINKDDK